LGRFAVLPGYFRHGIACYSALVIIRVEPMVFSLFGRKGKAATRKKGDGASVAEPQRRHDGHDPRTTIAAQREAARLTSQKIDQIESEIMATWEPATAAQAPDAAVPRAGAGAIAAVAEVVAAPKPEPVARAARPAEPKRGAKDGATGLIGHTIDANAIDIFGSSLPEILEEAAILYANGHSQEASVVLRQSLEDESTEAVRALGWMMLLDLFQTTGDKAAFEEMALAYAARFEASAPGWDDDQAASEEAAPAGAATAAFALPKHLDESAAAVCSRIARAMSRPGEVVIDCGPVRSVEASGAKLVLALIERCIAARQRAVIIQPEVLGEAAMAAVEPGRRDESPACWMLAMLALRLRSERQEFEDLAIEYCVTYEVSPPSWEAPPESIRTERRARHRSAEEPAFDPRSGAFVLSGELAGAMESELQSLRKYASERGDVVVDCRNLRRVDFVAAGAMLNAIVGLIGNGKKVLFVEPNHLVLALMMLMGIVDLVDIRRRRI